MRRKGYYTYPAHAVFSVPNEDGVEVTIETDGEGLRNPPEAFTRSRVVVLGDSFASAINTPAEETFVADLAELIAEPVYNAGVDGFSTFQETRLLRHLLDDGLHLHTVVLLFYLGNDFRDDLIEGKLTSQVGWMGSYPVSQAIGYIANPPVEIREALRRRGYALDGLKNLCGGRKLRLIVVGVFSKAEVKQTLEGFWWLWADHEYEAFNETRRRTDLSFDAPEFRLRMILAAGPVEYVPLLGTFRGHARDGLYGGRDSHWTGHGQALAADLVARYLRTNLARYESLYRELGADVRH